MRNNTVRQKKIDEKFKGLLSKRKVNENLQISPRKYNQN